MSGTVSSIDPTAGDPTAGDLPPDEPPITEIVDSPPDSPPFGDTTTPPPDTGTTPPETGGTADADFVVDARTLATDIAAHAPAPTLIADISGLFAHMLAAFTGALADIVTGGAGTPGTGGSTTPPDTVPPVVTPPTTDPGTATGGDPSTVPASGAGCWASHHPTAAAIPTMDERVAT